MGHTGLCHIHTPRKNMEIDFWKPNAIPLGWTKKQTSKLKMLVASFRSKMTYYLHLTPHPVAANEGLWRSPTKNIIVLAVTDRYWVGGGVDRGYYSLLQHVFQANFPMEHIPFFWVYCGWPLVMGMFFFFCWIPIVAMDVAVFPKQPAIWISTMELDRKRFLENDGGLGVRCCCL